MDVCVVWMALPLHACVPELEGELEGGDGADAVDRRQVVAATEDAALCSWVDVDVRGNEEVTSPGRISVDTDR